MSLDHVIERGIATRVRLSPRPGYEPPPNVGVRVFRDRELVWSGRAGTGRLELEVFLAPGDYAAVDVPIGR